LLLVGACILALIFLDSSGDLGRLVNRSMGKVRRKLPAAEDTGDIPVLDTEGEPEPASGQQTSALLPPLSVDSMIVTVRVMPIDEEGFPGEQLILCLREEGLQHGRFDIFHRIDDEDGSRSLYSVASLVEPGSFDLAQLRSTAYKGISMFMLIPGSRGGVAVFDDMLETARSIAKKLDGEVRDEQGSIMSVQRERFLREEVIEFERKLSAAPNGRAWQQ